MKTPVVIALHYQNDVLHEHGKIKVGLGDDPAARQHLVSAASLLLSGARDQGWPIFHVRVAYSADYGDLIQNAPIFKNVAKVGAVLEGSWGAEFLDALKPQDSALEQVITHNRINAFYGTRLEELIASINNPVLIVAGVATHSVVESTVRHAVDCGYEVSVVADACASASTLTHEASLNNMTLIADITRVSDVMRAFT
ncbi:cysteine hydrolase [Pseudomonas sp.]|uniref:cysteine hydrolase n=1 Tax=Pseudomonas sp. TaxID=306 RepID=UPI00260994F0|nr:cysteine hydrolase [Pseudomonas sp.]